MRLQSALPIYNILFLIFKPFSEESVSHHWEYLPFSSLWYEEVHEIAFQFTRLHTVQWERLGLVQLYSILKSQGWTNQAEWTHARIRKVLRYQKGFSPHRDGWEMGMYLVWWGQGTMEQNPESPSDYLQLSSGKESEGQPKALVLYFLSVYWAIFTIPKVGKAMMFRRIQRRLEELLAKGDGTNYVQTVKYQKNTKTSEDMEATSA